MTKRLERFLPDLIHEDQTGFIKGRQTHDNIRCTLHIIEHANKHHLNGALFSLNAQKTFDRVNCFCFLFFLYSILERFGFNDQFIKCIQCLYSDLFARIKISGHLTDSFKLFRGTHQACCASTGLFAIFYRAARSNY